MGGAPRLAAVAAAHAAHYRNHTQPVATHTHADAPAYSVNVVFLSATLLGVFVAMLTACSLRSPSPDKPDEDMEVAGVYTVSGDTVLNQVAESSHSPPPAYDTIVHDLSDPKDCCVLQEVVTEPCSCHAHARTDSGLPSYEAAVHLRDTKL